MTDYSLADERRITLRLLAYWEKQRAGRPMPARRDITTSDIADLWDSCFLIPAAPGVGPDYPQAYLGPGIAEACRFGLEKNGPGALPGWLAEGCGQVMATAKPLLNEGECRNGRDDIIKYRQCLLPLGEGGRIEAVFGGMRFKIFPAACVK